MFLRTSAQMGDGPGRIINLSNISWIEVFEDRSCNVHFGGDQKVNHLHLSPDETRRLNAAIDRAA